MRRIVLGILSALTLVACVPGSTATVGFTAGVEGAPPPPPVAMAEPPLEVVGGVEVVTDPSVRYDMFRYGGTWYLYSGGYWYRGSSYGGPFAVVDARHVPRRVLEVPPGHWKHHPRGGPPGFARKHGRDEGGDRED